MLDHVDLFFALILAGGSGLLQPLFDRLNHGKIYFSVFMLLVLLILFMTGSGKINENNKQQSNVQVNLTTINAKMHSIKDTIALERQERKKFENELLKKFGIGLNPQNGSPFIINGSIYNSHKTINNIKHLDTMNQYN